MNFWVLILLFALNQLCPNLLYGDQFSKTYSAGSHAASVRQTSDGGYIIAGSVDGQIIPGNGDSNIYLIKTDAEGNQVWSNVFWLGSFWNGANAVRQTSDGGYIVTGSMCGGYCIGGLIKTDAGGKVTWMTIRGDASAQVSGYDGLEAASGNYIMTGVKNENVYLLETDKDGSELWSKTLSSGLNGPGHSIQQTADGGFIIVGTTNFRETGLKDVLLIKTDSQGQELWSKTFGGNQDDQGFSVQATSDGGYIIAGETNSFGAGGFDVYVIKTDFNGVQLWSRTYGGVGDESGRSIGETTDNCFIITGWTQSFGDGGKDVYLIKIDGDGNEVWAKTFGWEANDQGSAVQQTSTGGFIVAGDTYSSGSTLPYALLIYYSPDGGSQGNGGAGGNSGSGGGGRLLYR